MVGSPDNVKFNYPVSQIPDALRDIRNFTLVDDKGRIWSSSSGHAEVTRMLTEAQQKLQSQPATTG